jgi:hypothetical protein
MGQGGAPLRPRPETGLRPRKPNPKGYLCHLSPDADARTPPVRPGHLLPLAGDHARARRFFPLFNTELTHYRFSSEPRL